MISWQYPSDLSSQGQIKKITVDELYYKISRQWTGFKLCKLSKSPNGDVKGSSWWPYLEWQLDAWKIQNANNRTILPNELVLDIDEKTYEENVKKAKEIVKYLKQKGMLYYPYYTGSKGFHIHLFYKINEASKEIMNKRINLLKHLGCDLLKCSSKTMIALENAPHWKTGKKKVIVEWLK